MGPTYDTGNYAAHLDRAIENADVAGYPARKAAAAAWPLRGIGWLLHRGLRHRAVEHRRRLGARAGLFEAGEVRVIPTGTVTVFTTGSHSHGQGHETTFAQVVAAKLGMPVENVEIVHGDTGRIPSAWAPTAAARWRSAAPRSSRHGQGHRQGKKIAAHLLEAADTDIEFENGEFKVKAPTRRCRSARWR